MELGARKLDEKRQVDTYFNAPHRDFLEGQVVSEWLRIRDEGGGRCSINFKRWHPVGAIESTHCEEYESSVGDDKALFKLLEALDFREMVTVDKTRERWQLDDVEVAIDQLADIGTFVELEFTGQSANVEQARNRLQEMVRRIGVELGERDGRGYPYMLLGRDA